ncbi:hypothetical protein RIF29_38307 [Crotalaria pallida]|uniref:Uncharacterized protein n=1 Tax=Crotalaria pallida TaxID=3830 RepID=A0AAN9DZ23_CROPI
MASYPCDRPAEEITCETKCHDNISSHMTSRAGKPGIYVKVNHQYGHEHHANGDGHYGYGHQSDVFHNPGDTISKTQTQTTVIKTHCTECVSQSHGQHAAGHCQSHIHDHNSSMEQHSSAHGNGMAAAHSNAKTESHGHNNNNMGHK